MKLYFWFFPAAVLALAAVILWRRKRAVRTALGLAAAAAVEAGAMAGIFFFCLQDKKPWIYFRWDFFLTGVFLLMLLFFLAAVFIMEPVGHITRTVKEMEKGNYDIEKKRYPKDDVGELWLSVVRLAAVLSLRRYQEDCREKGLRRFVPEMLAEWLGKTPTAGLRAGEFRRIRGVFGVVSMQLKEEAPGDEVYQEAVCEFGRRLFRLLSRCGGTVPAGGFSLEGVRVSFPGAAEAASFLEELNNKTETEYVALLHWTDCGYGTAGDEKRLVPVLISRELSRLGSLSRSLFEAGVNAVITEEVLDRLGKKPPVRCIGFVSFDSGRTACRLYEVLGIYGEAGKRLRMETKLKEGLSLYYKNDFYLARSCFSEAARECPGDGIARWYVFASEYYFNAGEDGEIGYELFDRHVKAGAEGLL